MGSPSSGGSWERWAEGPPSTQEVESRDNELGQGSRHSLARSWCANKGVCREDGGPGSNQGPGEDKHHEENQRGCESPGVACWARTRSSNSTPARELSPYCGPGRVPGAREVPMLGRRRPGGTDPRTVLGTLCCHRCKRVVFEQYFPSALGQSCVTLGKNRFTEGPPWQCSGCDSVLPVQGMRV